MDSGADRYAAGGNKKTPLTDVRGERYFHGTTLICPYKKGISCHLITVMNRSAPRGPLQSGVLHGVG